MKLGLSKVSKNYYSRTNNLKHKKPALNNVTVNFPETGMVFLTGKNGSGKSTILNIIGGLDAPTKGDFFYDEINTNSFSVKDWENYRNQFIGFIFQNRNLFENETVYSNIELALSLQQNSNSNVIGNALEDVGLGGLSQRKIKELSGGQKQRVAIARAIAKNSQVILADEPTANLDPTTADVIFQLLLDYSETHLVILVTHDVTILTKSNDTNNKINEIRLHKGEIIYNSFDTIKNNIVLEHKAKPLERGNLNFKHKLHFSLNILFHRLFTFFLLIILSAITLSLLISRLKAYTITPYDAYLEAAAENNFLAIKIKDGKNPVDGGLHFRPYYRYFSPKDISTIKTNFSSGLSFMKGYELNLSASKSDNKKIDSYYKNYLSLGILSTKQDLEQLNFNLIAGEYPSDEWSKNDVLIPYYLFESIKNQGFADKTDVSIQLPSDLIGLNLREYKIKGVIDTHFDKPEFSSIKKYALGESEKYDMYSKVASNFQEYLIDSPHTALYFAPHSVPSDKIKVLFSNFNKDYIKSSKFLEYISNDEEYQLTGPYLVGLSKVYHEFHDDSIERLPVDVGIFIVCFLLQLMFHLTIFYSTKRDMGILLSLGTKKKDIISIYFLNNLMTDILSIIVSIPLYIFLFLNTYNAWTYNIIPLYRFDFTDFLMIVGFVAFR